MTVEKVKNKTSSILVGLFTGVINGLFGGGGGMLLVPLLTGVLKKTQKTAHATAILIILPTTVLSAILYSSFGQVTLEVLPVSVGVTLGGVLGALFLKKASPDLLFYIFYALMLFAGVKMAV